MRMQFYIEGPHKKGVVHLDVQEVSIFYCLYCFSRFFLGRNCQIGSNFKDPVVSCGGFFQKTNSLGLKLQLVILLVMGIPCLWLAATTYCCTLHLIFTINSWLWLFLISCSIGIPVVDDCPMSIPICGWRTCSSLNGENPVDECFPARFANVIS